MFEFDFGFDYVLVFGGGYYVGYGDVFWYSVFGYVVVKFVLGGCLGGWILYNKYCYFFSRDRFFWW